MSNSLAELRLLQKLTNERKESIDELSAQVEESSSSLKKFKDRHNKLSKNIKALSEYNERIERILKISKDIAPTFNDIKQVYISLRLIFTLNAFRIMIVCKFSYLIP